MTARKADLRVIRELVRMTCGILLKDVPGIGVDGLGLGCRYFTTVESAVAEAMQFDEVIISRGRDWVRFVLYNSPDCALSNYTVSLEEELKPVSDAADAWDHGEFDIKFGGGK